MDLLIKKTVKSNFPKLLETFGEEGWLWVKALVKQESAFNPRAISPVGARGLMQIMPATWDWLGGTGDPFDPEQNVHFGIKFLSSLYDDFEELPDPLYRLFAAMSSYNCGKGYINVALALAREFDNKPYGYRAWINAGRPYGFWQHYENWSGVLIHPRCVVRGRRPDVQQVLGYIKHIKKHYRQML